MNWVLILLLAISGFLLIWYRGRLLTAIGNLFQDNATAFIAILISFVAAGVLIILFQPQFFQFLFSAAGPTGPDRRVAEAKADMYELSLQPNIHPSSWSSEAAKAAVENVASEFELATAKNKAGISAAEADRLSHLPKGHPDRALWDAAKMDPAAGSLPPAVQVAQSRIGEIAENAGKVDLAAMTKELSKPVGQAPTDVDPWFRQWFYGVPVFVPAMIGLISLGLILALVLSVLMRGPQRA